MPHNLTFLEEVIRIRAVVEANVIARDISFVRPNIIALAAELDMPICALTIIGKYFQHIKVSVGTDLAMTERKHAFCAHTIEQDGVMVVEDATKDVRFRDNPYVVNWPKIRFYAGAPILTIEGQKLGAVCLLDDKPRTLTANMRSHLSKSTSVIAAIIQAKKQAFSLSELDVKSLIQS